MNKNPEILRHEYDIKSLHEEIKSIKNYCSDKFTELQASYGALQASNGALQTSHGTLRASHSALQASHSVLQTSNSAMPLQWHKIYRRQCIYEVRRFITSTLLTLIRSSFFLDMQHNSPMEICFDPLVKYSSTTCQRMDWR
jgi:hypothetical protein